MTHFLTKVIWKIKYGDKMVGIREKTIANAYNRVFLHKLIIALKYFQPFMEQDVSLPCKQEPDSEYTI
jgi:hypothetical protein